ncbi:MAG: TolC family protein, partial [Gemmatimonadota bacterium]|nr:TolC family protein [Gemmatimonadota bacterium]
MHAYIDRFHAPSRAAMFALSLAVAVLAAPMGAQTVVKTSAATATPATITFNDAIAIALRQNTTLRQSENAAAMSATNVTNKKSAFLPTLSLVTNSAENVGRTFSQLDGAVSNQTSHSLSTGLSSSVVLFDGLRNVSELRAAKSSEAASNSDLTRARQTTVFTVASDLLRLVTAQAQLQVQQQNLSAQEAQESQLQKLVAAGARPISELYQQQATTASARSTVVTASHQVDLGKIALIQTLQLDPRATYDFVAPAIPTGPRAAQRFQLDSLLDRAFASRVDLVAEQERVDAAVQGTKAATASRLPTVSLSAGYNTAYNSTSDLAFSDQLNQRRGGSLSIGVSLPIFDRGATTAATQQARLQEDNARLALADQRQTIALEVRRAYLDNESTREQLAAAEAQQKAADLAVSTTQQRYQLGSSTLLELTLARAAQVQAASAVVTARSTLVFQEALMSYYT